jgi:anti-anti-sigma factor
VAAVPETQVVAQNTSVADGPVLVVRDELDLATTPELRRRVERALAARPATLTIDLSDCAFIGADAVSLLASLTVAGRRHGTAVVLVGLRPATRRVIALLDLDDSVVAAG